MSTYLEPVIACDLTAIPADERDQHTATVRGIFQAVEAVRELDNGYAFRLPLENAMLVRAATFIENERLCCPFFGFALEIEPANRSFYLRLTGGEGVKAFVMAELGSHLPEAVLQAANLA